MVPALSVFLLAGCSSKPPLPTYGMVSDFSLTDSNGAAFSSKALEKHVWIADFIYTTCPGPCPRMSSQMLQAQKAIASDAIRFVSFTVDPQHDTPTVLAAYAKHFEADPAKWFFLTGDIAAINHLSRDVFRLAATDGTLEHSTRFILIDGQSRIRGFYSSLEKDIMPRLIDDTRQLLKEGS
jgi:protein SCO1